MPKKGGSLNRVLVTGANGHLGRRLIHALQPEQGDVASVRALVRSEKAREMIVREAYSQPPEVVVGDYLSRRDVERAMEGCTAVVHLVGIIKENKHNGFFQAHVDTTRVLCEAAAKAHVNRIVYLSIVGSAPAHTNTCLASKGAAETLLLGCPVPALVLRVPMVLGEGDFASRALARRVKQSIAFVLRASSLEQPIYAGDVVAALMAWLMLEPAPNLALDLGGPEILARVALQRRAAQCLGERPRFIPLPGWLAQVFAAVVQTLLPYPPVTTAMLGVLDHDDHVDSLAALELLDIELTPLNETLSRCLVNGSPDTNTAN